MMREGFVLTVKQKDTVHPVAITRTGGLKLTLLSHLFYAKWDNSVQYEHRAILQKTCF